MVDYPFATSLTNPLYLLSLDRGGHSLESPAEMSDLAHIPPVDGSVGKLNRSDASSGVLTINTPLLYISIGLVVAVAVFVFHLLLLSATFINDNITLAMRRSNQYPIR